MKNQYIERPWSLEQTVENLKDLKQILQNKVVAKNLDGLGKEDAEEVAIDFDRAIEAVEKQIPKKPDKSQRDIHGSPIERCPSCYSFGVLKYCAHCGQKIDWSEGK